MAEPHNTPVPGSTPRATSPVHGAGAGGNFVPQHQLHPNAPPPPLASPSQPTTYASARPRVLYLGDPVNSSAAASYQELAARYDVIIHHFHQPQPAAAIEDGQQQQQQQQQQQRARLVQALRDRTWGDLAAVVRPSASSCGFWDAELVDLLPASVRVVASADDGAEERADGRRRLRERGIVYYCPGDETAADADAVAVSTPGHVSPADAEELCVRKVMSVLEGDGRDSILAIGGGFGGREQA
ncbi:hypothetical protein JDV02_005673 [Purpureocillium takamizusanense]|uniref:Uncharacterized protein n=1 Tax=Purpureocillium takamizusanense TaxID=2060973 RepID=A0A9Q8VC03_9HYPO|nr:uncharacterized protein JDV02_005673 [Purpureocillium takamizusanense]UNI19491.1 hypothetical protein JDV02_005673 [Purpureocillium takamizusanense]